MRSFLVSRQRVFGFLCFWIVGILAGTLAAAGTDDSVLSLMRRAAMCRVSIVGLFLTAVLPFLIAAYAVSIHKDPLLFVFCALRGFGFGYCAWLIVRAFGPAAWLVQPMLQFSDNILMAVYCFFGLWFCSGRGGNLKRWLIACILLTAAVTVFDYLAVSPFLAMLLES